MANELQSILDDIKRDKDSNLLPQNLKDGVTCLGINGDLEPSNVILTDSIESLNNIPPEDGKYGLLYKKIISPIMKSSKFDKLYLSNNIILDTSVNESVSMGFRMVDSWGDLYVYVSSTECNISGYGENGSIEGATYSSSDGINYVRTTGNDILELGGTFAIDEYSTFNEDDFNIIRQFMLIENGVFNGVYGVEDSQWTLAPTQLNAEKKFVYKKNTFYGINGIENGTLCENISTNMDDVNADIFNEIQEKYFSIPTISLTKENKNQYIKDTMKIIPAGSNGKAIFDLSGMSDGSDLFKDCRQIVSIAPLDTSNLTNMSYFFYNCQKLKYLQEKIDTSKVTNMNCTFFGCESLTTIPSIDTSKVTNMTYMFSGCESLERIPNINTNNLTKAMSMFRGCSSLKTIPNINLSKVSGTDAISLFEGCINLETIPNMDTSKITYTNNFFMYCRSITELPELDFSNVTSSENMFSGCTSLVTIPKFNFSKVVYGARMFNSCSSLEVPPVFNFSSLRTNYSMFTYCKSLTDEGLNNILLSMGTISNPSYKTLEDIGLTEEQANRCVTLSGWSNLASKGWTTGY